MPRRFWRVSWAVVCWGYCNRKFYCLGPQVLVPAGRPKHDAMYDQLFGLPAVDLYDPPSGGVERALAKAEAESSADVDEILAGLEGQTALE